MTAKDFYELKERVGDEKRIDRFIYQLKEILDVYPLENMTLSEAIDWLSDRGDTLRITLYNDYVDE